MQFKLTYEELIVLREAVDKLNLRNLLLNKDANNVTLDISEDDAIDLRDACGDYLLTDGFDEDYKPNAKGKILENLIDKLFTG